MCHSWWILLSFLCYKVLVLVEGQSLPTLLQELMPIVAFPWLGGMGEDKFVVAPNETSPNEPQCTHQMKHGHRMESCEVFSFGELFHSVGGVVVCLLWYL